MTYPKLIRQSKGSQKIPNPQDFGLDKVVDKIFSRSVGEYRDFVEDGFYLATYDDNYDERDDGSRVLDYAKNLICHSETDTEKIAQRQKLLQEFMNNPELTNLVLQSRIDRKSDSANYTFRNRTERGKDFLEYIRGISNVIGETKNPELTSLKRYVNALLEKSKRIHELQTILSDIASPVKLKVNWEFTARDSSYGETYFRYANKSFSGVFASGETQDMEDRGYNDQSDLGIQYKFIGKTAIAQIKSKAKKNVAFNETPTSIDIIVDEETGKITTAAAYKKLKVWKSILHLKTVTEDVNVPIEFNEEDHINANHFRRAIEDLKERKYEDPLLTFDKEVSEFANAVIELRYLALAADYFNKSKDKGLEISMPKISPINSQKTQFTNLIDPVLLERMPRGNIVSNNVYADNKINLFVITGPNNNGKTTYMDSIGIAQATGQAGLMIHAKDSEISPKDNIFSHYIRPGDITVAESRHAHELSRVKEIVNRATPYSMILIDEIGTGTSPDDGKQFVEDVLLTVGDIGATGYISTHFHNMSAIADKILYAKNVHCVARENGKSIVYTYKIADGPSNKSNGIYLARQMGADRQGLRDILKGREKTEKIRFRK